MNYKLEDVYKSSGYPEITFVEPPEFTKLLVGLRTKGRSIVVEGPSGIGKTSCIKRAIEDLNIQDSVLLLSARKKDDIELIANLSTMACIGIVIIDDFHILNEDIQSCLADFMKTLSDEENEESKVIAIGINKAGHSLIKHANDLNNRVDTIKFESNPTDKIIELISKGEKALNIKFSNPENIAELSTGSFHLAQIFCKEACMESKILETQDNLSNINISIEVVREKIFKEESRVFASIARDFAIGSKLKPEGRAPYFHFLYWLAQKNDWSINLNDMAIENPNYKGSITQIIEKNS